MYAGEERGTQGFGGINLMEKDDLEEPITDGRIII